MNKSKVSFCILCYNQESYIKDSIESVVSQDYSNLEIIISDDCSTDKTFSIVNDFKRNYTGEHTIIINQNQKNLGLGAHFSKVMAMTTGEYIINLGGDDISMKDHISYSVSKIEEFSNFNMIDFNAKIIDQNGKFVKDVLLDFESKESSLDEYIKLKKIYSFAPGRIFRKSFIDSFNPISSNCPTEDSVLVLRSLLTGGLLRINRYVVYYRQHSSNISNSTGLSRLSNHAIISQYLKDVLNYYDKGLIDDTKLEMLLNRVFFQLKLRAVIYKKSNRLIKAIWIRYIKYKYVLKLSI